MEPPSPIAKTSNIEADAMSDDPLANCIFMILGESSVPDSGNGGRFVCAYSANTGFLYIGMTGETAS